MIIIMDDVVDNITTLQEFAQQNNKIEQKNGTH